MSLFAGFVGPAYIAPSITQDDQELVNLYVEIDPNKKPDERGYAALYPTPGLKRLAIAGTTEIRGLWTAPGDTLIFIVAGNILYQNIPFGIVGTLATSTGQVQMVDNGTSLFLADGVHRYAYTWGTGVFQTLTDGAFIAADIVDEIDNYVVYNNPGTNIWGCTDIGATTSGGLNFARKDSTPDLIISLFVNRRQIFIFGERTTEVWIDAGLFPFPFQRLPGAVLQHGCVAAHSPAILGEACAWLSQDTRGDAIVLTVDGAYQPSRISTHAVETDIATFSRIDDAFAFSYQQGGHEFYQLTFPTGDRTWVYDLTSATWHKRAWRDASNVLHRHRANCFAFFQGNPLVGDYQNGNLYIFDRNTFVDEIGAVGHAGDSPIPRIRRCPHLTTELKRQFFHDLVIQFQPGVGLATGQGSDPQAMLKWSDDGGSTWSNEHWRSIGKVGQYKNRARWSGLGEARDRIFEVQVTDPVYAAIISADLNVSAGAS